MSNTECRKEFEEWATANQNAYFPDFTRSRDSPNDYYGIATQAAWEAWQASRAKPIVLPSAIYVYDLSARMIGVDDVKEAIEAAGYRCEK